MKDLRVVHILRPSSTTYECHRQISPTIGCCSIFNLDYEDLKYMFLKAAGKFTT